MADAEAEATPEDARLEEALSGKDKAAILFICLGSELAAEIFKHLEPDEIEAITFEIARIEVIEPEVKESVLREFKEMMMAQDFILTGGIPFAKDLLIQALGESKAEELISRLTSAQKTRPFEFIRSFDPAHLINFLQQEHPQTISLVLSYMPPQMAAEILSHFTGDVQADIAKRIATMERTSPEVLREVERVLEKKLSALSREGFSEAGGVESIVDILNKADRTTEKSILENLEEDDPELAEEIKKRMLLFEDIVMLDDASIQIVLRNVDQAELGKALKGCEDSVQEKIFSNMSQRAGTMLKEDMEFMGPIRKKDVEEVQQRIVGVIRMLEEKGEIVVIRTSESEMVG